MLRRTPIYIYILVYIYLYLALIQKAGWFETLYIYIYICLLYFAGTELNNQIVRAVFINKSTKTD